MVVLFSIESTRQLH